MKYLKLYIRHKILVINLNQQRKRYFNNGNQIYELALLIEPNNSNRHNYQDIGMIIYELNASVTRFITNYNVFSVITNVLSICILFMHTFLRLKDYSSLIGFCILLYDFVYLVKHGSLFFFFIIFNRNFRKQFFN